MLKIEGMTKGVKDGLLTVVTGWARVESNNVAVYKIVDGVN